MAKVIKVYVHLCPMNTKTQVIKYIHLIILLISLTLYGIAMYAPGVLAFIYPFWLYKILSQGLSIFVALFPFSLAEVLLLLFPLYGLYRLGKGLYLWIGRTGKAGAYWRTMGRQSGKLACYLLSIFILSAGINYHRTSLAAHAGLEVQPAQQEELLQLCMYLADLTNEAAGLTGRDSAGGFVSDYSFNQNRKRVGEAYHSLSQTYPACKGWYPSSKPLYFSHWVSYAHIMGFFFPFTFEANINKDIPAFMIPAVIAHEQAHLRGFMREEDAEYAVFLLTRHTHDPNLRYSFYMAMLMRIMGVLYRADPEDYQQWIAGFSKELVHDLNAYIDYWSAFRSPIGDISQTVNDAYLKANSQSEGVQSYGRVIDLLMADYKLTQNLKKQEYEHD